MGDTLLKVLIVDDEYLVRNLLKNCINWNEFGFLVAGEAASAHEALDMVSQLNPDVIFTDIYMPYMDGLEFSRIVCERYPHIKIIILTGHERFDYAKKSIKIGVTDFLLKPINDDEIKKVVANLKDKIMSERSERDEYDRMKKQLEENFPYLKEKFLNEMLQSDFNCDESAQSLEYYNIMINPKYIQVAVIEATTAESGSEAFEEGKLLLKMKCQDTVGKHYAENPYVHVFSDNSQNIVVLNSDETIDLAESLEDVKNALIEKLNCYICIGVGNFYGSEGRIRTSYREAANAVNYKVIAGKNQVIAYCDINLSNAENYNFQNNNFDTLSFHLKAGMKKKVAEFIESTFSELVIEGKPLQISFIRVMASNIISVMLSVITEAGINISDIFPNNSQPFEKVFKIDTLPDMKEYLLSLNESIINTIQSMQNKRVSQVISQVIDFIQQNLSDPEISLSSIAKKYFINMSYLSRIFKQGTGHTFVEYLTKVRMEKATKLLKETDMKAYQVAEAVGIVNPHYFGICFKKWTGVSVNDFKKIEQMNK